MPYGVDKNIGGDNKENDSWMENCVRKVKAQGKDEGSAIAICKNTLQKMRGDHKKASLVISTMIDNKTLDPNE